MMRIILLVSSLYFADGVAHLGMEFSVFLAFGPCIWCLRGVQSRPLEWIIIDQQRR